jgi:carbon starvation protein
MVTSVPAAWLVICTVSAGWQKVFSIDPQFGFLSHAHKFSDAIAANQVLAPAKTLGEMGRIVLNDYVHATLAALFVAVVLAMVVYGVMSIRRAAAAPGDTAREAGAVGAA